MAPIRKACRGSNEPIEQQPAHPRAGSQGCRRRQRRAGFHAAAVRRSESAAAVPGAPARRRPDRMGHGQPRADRGAPAGTRRHPLPRFRGGRHRRLRPLRQGDLRRRAGIPVPRLAAHPGHPPVQHLQLHRLPQRRAHLPAQRALLFAGVPAAPVLLLRHPVADRRRDPAGRHPRAAAADRPGSARGIPPAQDHVRAQLRRRHGPALADGVPERGPRRGRGLLREDRHPAAMEARQPPAYPPDRPGHRPPPAHRRGGVVQPRHLLQRPDPAGNPARRADRRIRP
ncbi:hypothetical protein D3C76_1077830 [compost metagenome]